MVADKVVAPVQTAFIKGRFILDGVVILHEALHETVRKKKNVLMFKVDFEKACDKINWEFFLEMLSMKGFPDKFIEWVRKIVSSGNIAVMVNGQIGQYFKTKKGLRQGDPLSPILFDIAVDVLQVLIKRAQDSGLLRGVIPNLVERGLRMLQYADETVFFIEANESDALNLKYLLCCFEHLSGLKINFHKSETVCFGETKANSEKYRDIFTCVEGKLPMKYLGIPAHNVMLRNVDWKNAEEKMGKKLGTWQGRFLSYGGKLALIKGSLSNLFT